MRLMAVLPSTSTGRAIFQEALAAGTLSGFFRLIEQYSTQVWTALTDTAIACDPCTKHLEA
jgi:hypothetical protein